MHPAPNILHPRTAPVPEASGPERLPGRGCALALVALLMLGSWAPAGEPARADLQPAPFFRVAIRDGSWFFIDPNGERFLSIGVNVIQMEGDRIRGKGRSPYLDAAQAKYTSEETWRDAVAAQLLGHGFNTIGAWSDAELMKPVVAGASLMSTPILHLAEYAAKQMDSGNIYDRCVDVFDPAFAEHALAGAQARCAAWKDDRRIVGWFTDNELRWGVDWRGNEEVIGLFLAMKPGAPGRREAVSFLKGRYPAFEAFEQVWKTGRSGWDELENGKAVRAPYVRAMAFLQQKPDEIQKNERDPRRAAFAADCDAFTGVVAERYFSVVYKAVRTAAPNHLNLGCRFAYVPPAPVLAAAAKWVDVISINCYVTDPKRNLEILSAPGRPVLVSEFTFRAKDSGLPNTKGAGPIVADQYERAKAFTDYAGIATALPCVVGYHWFQYIDMPKEGRKDGEDGNCGLVTTGDEPYTEVLQAMREFARKAIQVHAPDAPQRRPVAKKPDPAPAPAPALARKQVPTPEAVELFEQRLRERVMESVRLGRGPYYDSEAMKRKVSIESADEEGISMRANDALLRLPWRSINGADRLAIALDLVRLGSPVDHAQAAFRLIAAGRAQEAQVHLERTDAALLDVAQAFIE